MAELLSSDYVEKRAEELMPRANYDFIAGGADDEFTLRANVEGLRRYRLRTRILQDVRRVDTSVELFGRKLESPIFVPPMGGHRLAAEEGELASARGASWARVAYMMSTASNYTLEDVAEVLGPGKWFQLYCFKDRAVTEDLVRRAEAAGYEALCVTVDAPVLGLRRRDVRNEFAPGPQVHWANLEPYGLAALPDITDGNTVLVYFLEQIDASLTWKDLEWLRSITSLPLVVKGVLSGDDAGTVVDLGFDGVYVSNHGGRQLDRAPGTIEALPEVIDVVGGRVPVLVDGGFRSSGDIAVALALGAAAVGVGRPVLYALAIGGDEATAAYLGGLVRDLERTMALVGARTVGELDRSRVMAL
jgi:isopentenyl diphosphate isomerase/L-lactate dehydrogenase-like FMN-dependent dehydrogenase